MTLMVLPYVPSLHEDMIWAVTQAYADLAPQFALLLERLVMGGLRRGPDQGCVAASARILSTSCASRLTSSGLVT